jgi:hypothetical protein
MCQGALITLAAVKLVLALMNNYSGAARCNPAHQCLLPWSV